MSRYILVNEDNVVINCIEWDGDTNKWSPPAGLTAILSDEYQAGWLWDGDKLVDPNPPVEESAIMATEGLVEV